MCGTDMEMEVEGGGGDGGEVGDVESSFSMLLVEKVVYLFVFSNNLW